MEILSSLLLVVIAIGLVLYALLTEGLDWIGRAEIIEHRWPLLWGAMNNRPMRLILIVVAIGMLARVVGDFRAGAEPPEVKFQAPKVPEINSNVKVITIGSTGPHHCWFSNHFGMPNSTIKGAVTATAIIIHCNYKVDAPFAVSLEFDRDFIPGALVLPDSGAWSLGPTRKAGMQYYGAIASPALLSDQLAIMTVYGTTDQYPRSIRGKIDALK
jgi:hypothetical protein